jgi:hypothetical protein
MAILSAVDLHPPPISSTTTNAEVVQLNSMSRGLEMLDL